MKYIWSILIFVSLFLVMMLFLWMREMPVSSSIGHVQKSGMSTVSNSIAVPQEVIRIGLVPEHDIFAQQKRYEAIANYLSSRLGIPVKLITVNTYESIFYDFENKEIEMAFLGSLVALLSIDRYGAEVVLKPELEGGISSYHGVIFTRGETGIDSIEDLAGKTLAMVRTTTAGHLFPLEELVTHGVWSSLPARPKLVWLGTHDEVISAVANGIVDAGAAKNLRLDIYEELNPGITFKRISESGEVPNNALLFRSDVSVELQSLITSTLLGMPDDIEGLTALHEFGANKFIVCELEEFQAIYRMIEPLRNMWDETDIGGRIPG